MYENFNWDYKIYFIFYFTFSQLQNKIYSTICYDVNLYFISVLKVYLFNCYKSVVIKFDEKYLTLKVSYVSVCFVTKRI